MAIVPAQVPAPARSGKLPPGDFDYDRRREHEIRQLVAAGKLDRARELASSIRGRKLMLELFDWIDGVEAHAADVAARHAVGGHG